MTFRILIKPSALSELAKIPKTYATQIAEAIDSLSKNPWPKGYRKLKARVIITGYGLVVTELCMTLKRKSC